MGVMRQICREQPIERHANGRMDGETGDSRLKLACAPETKSYLIGSLLLDQMSGQSPKKPNLREKKKKDPSGKRKSKADLIAGPKTIPELKTLFFRAFVSHEATIDSMAAAELAYLQRVHVNGLEIRHHCLQTSSSSVNQQRLS